MGISRQVLTAKLRLYLVYLELVSQLQNLIQVGTQADMQEFESLSIELNILQYNVGNYNEEFLGCCGAPIMPLAYLLIFDLQYQNQATVKIKSHWCEVKCYTSACIDGVQRSGIRFSNSCLQYLQTPTNKIMKMRLHKETSNHFNNVSKNKLS